MHYLLTFKKLILEITLANSLFDRIVDSFFKLTGLYLFLLFFSYCQHWMHGTRYEELTPKAEIGRASCRERV